MQIQASTNERGWRSWICTGTTISGARRINVYDLKFRWKLRWPARNYYYEAFQTTAKETDEIADRGNEDVSPRSVTFATFEQFETRKKYNTKERIMWCCITIKQIRTFLSSERVSCPKCINTRAITPVKITGFDSYLKISTSCYTFLLAMMYWLLVCSNNWRNNIMNFIYLFIYFFFLFIQSENKLCTATELTNFLVLYNFSHVFKLMVRN